MSGNGRLMTRTLLALPLATGVLLAFGCGLKPGGGGGRTPSKEPTGAVPSGVEHVDTREEKPASTPARSAIEKVGAMTDEEISARTGEIDGRIEDAKKQHRKRLEPLFDILKTVCLREPDYRAVSRANTLEQMVHSGATAESVRGYGGMFRRETTKERIEAIAKEIETHRDTIKVLIAEKPNEIVIRRWNEIAEEFNGRVGTANDLRSKSGRARPLEASSRAAVLDAIDALARTNQECRAGVDEVRAALLDSRAKFATFEGQAKHFPGFTRNLKDAFSAIDKSVAKLDDLKATDHSAVFAFHRRFASGLPTSLTSMHALNTLGEAVRKDRAESPEMWSLAAISSLYPQWQMLGYDEAIVRGNLGSRVEAAAEARHSEYDRWRAAALKLSPEEAESLVSFLSKNAIDATKVDADLVPILRDVIEENGIPALPEGSLAATNPRLAARKLSLKGDADRYHTELIRKLNANREIADIASIKGIVRRGAREVFSQKAVRFYAGWQGEQWLEYASRHFGDSVRKAAADYQWWETPPNARWVEQAKSIDPVLVKQVIELLSSGVLDPQMFLWHDRWGVYCGMAMARDLPLRPIDLDFWLDVAKVRGIGTSGLPRPGPDGGAGLLQDPRSYHAVLKERLEGAADLAALAPLMAAITSDQKANPNHWADAERPREYAEFLVRRFYPVFENRYGKRALTAVEKWKRKSAYPEPWKEACRAFTQAEVEAILGFLQGGVIDQRTFDGRLQHLTGFNRDKLRAVSLKFWQEVGKIVGAGVGD